MKWAHMGTRVTQRKDNSGSLVHSVSYFEMCSKLHFVFVAFPKDMMSQQQHFDLNKKGRPWVDKYKYRT